MRVRVEARRANEDCPFCKAPLEDRAWHCPKCGTGHHLACAREHGKCTVHGCGVVVPVRERVPASRPRRGPTIVEGLWGRVIVERSNDPGTIRLIRIEGPIAHAIIWSFVAVFAVFGLRSMRKNEGNVEAPPASVLSSELPDTRMLEELVHRHWDLRRTPEARERDIGDMRRHYLSLRQRCSDPDKLRDHLRIRLGQWLKEKRGVLDPRTLDRLFEALEAR